MTECGPLPEIRYEAGTPTGAGLPLLAVGLSEGTDPTSLPVCADTTRNLFVKGDFRGERPKTSGGQGRSQNQTSKA